MKVIKVDSSNDQGADFQIIKFKELFQELQASVEGKKDRYKSYLVKNCESLKTEVAKNISSNSFERVFDRCYRRRYHRDMAFKKLAPINT